MTNRYAVVGMLAVLLPVAAVAQAATSDEVHVIRGAIEFYRDSIRKGRIVLDQTSPDRLGPAVSVGVVDQVAQITQSEKGRLTDLLDCRKGPGRGCTMRQANTTVLSFSRLLIRTGIASVYVISTYASEGGRVESVEEQVTLVKEADGRWKVQKVDERSVS